MRLGLGLREGEGGGELERVGGMGDYGRDLVTRRVSWAVPDGQTESPDGG